MGDRARYGPRRFRGVIEDVAKDVESAHRGDGRTTNSADNPRQATSVATPATVRSATAAHIDIYSLL